MGFCASRLTRAQRWVGITAIATVVLLGGCGKAPDPEDLEVKAPAPPTVRVLALAWKGSCAPSSRSMAATQTIGPTR